ncbi:hypothetical protein BYT27DRAFT_7291818, partial [Phlegmacium glaucopus]
MTGCPQARGWSMKAMSSCQHNQVQDMPIMCCNMCCLYNPLCYQSELGSAMLKATACSNQY